MVALYSTTDCFKVETRARTKSITLRTIRRIAMPHSRCNEALLWLSEILHETRSITSITSTGEKGGKKQGDMYV